MGEGGGYKKQREWKEEKQKGERESSIVFISLSVTRIFRCLGQCPSFYTFFVVSLLSCYKMRIREIVGERSLKKKKGRSTKEKQVERVREGKRDRTET